MGLIIFFATLLVLALIGLIVLFSVQAKEKYLEGKKTKSVFAIIGGLIAIALLVNLIIHLFPLTINGMIQQCVGCTVAGTILTWLAAPLIKKNWKKVLILISPLVFFAYIIYIGFNVVFGEVPLTKEEVEFTEPKKLSEVLGNVALPEIEYCESWQMPYGQTVVYRLVNEADSSKLSASYATLKEQKPLQIIVSERTPRMYMSVNPDMNQYINVMFKKAEIALVYGEMTQEDQEYKEKFESINAPLPDCNILTYMFETFGPDWTLNQRLEFTEPVPMEWIDQVKQTAENNKAWSFIEGNDAFIISYRDNEESHRILEMLLYKNLGGDRKVADIEWGSY